MDRSPREPRAARRRSRFDAWSRRCLTEASPALPFGPSPALAMRLPFLCLTLLALAGAPAAQASFVETFDSVGPVSGDGPGGLGAAGWIFRNQSEPKGTKGWFAGGSLLQPFEGSGYLAVDGNSTGSFGGDISDWAILPAVPNQIAGDVLTFHVQRSFSHSTEVLEVRYSPSGGTQTGSGFAGTGDFTGLLLELPLTSSGWQTVSVPLPGDGRVALRYVVENACLFGCSVPYVGFDLLSVGPAPGPGCNLPPLPQSGQTVHWTAAGGPWEICADVSIPPGGTVIVDPGASVAIDPSSTLTVSGVLLAQGTAAQPITFDGWGSIFGAGFEVDGTAELDHALVRTQLHALAGGSILVRDSAFQGYGLSSKPVLVGPGHGTYLEVERSTVDGADLGVTDGTLVLSDVDLVDGGVSVLRGYLRVEDVSIDGSAIAITRERYTQPTWLDTISVTNSPVAALVLQGWNFHVGPNAVLQGNQRPADLIGGLLPGSNIPATGNAQNHVAARLLVGSSIWGALDVPYVVSGVEDVGGSSLEIEAGTTVEMQPDAAMLLYGGAGIRARGTQHAPIVIQPHVPGTSWDRIKFQSTSGHIHFEWTAFSGADVALQSDNSNVFVDASVFQGNQTGLWTNTFGLMTGRKLQMIGNAVGAHEESGLMDLRGETNPNSFVGNGAAIDSGDALATSNWWGDASGPAHAQNPGGTGDFAAPGTTVLPFLTQAPDFGDAPPRVSLFGVQSPQEAGAQLLLTWTSEDDRELASHNILFSPYGNIAYEPLVTGLPGSARSVLVTVPQVMPSSIIDPAHFRVVAVDDAGQEGWDEIAVLVPYVEDISTGTFELVTDVSGPFTMNDDLDVEFHAAGISATFSTSIVSDVDGRGVPYGGGHTGIDGWDYTMPYMSTDTARIWITYNLGAGNRSITYRSPTFTVRPDARVGDAAPTIALTSPAPGASYAGGDVVPIAWAASDDESVRRIQLSVSLDGGETWGVFAELDGDAQSYGWKLPTLTSLPDVRLRAAAIDLRYQNSSDTIPLGLLAGEASPCAVDLGFGGPGGSVLSLCGDPLASGAQVPLSLQNGPPTAPAWLGVSTQLQPIEVLGGTLAPFPPSFVLPLMTDAAGGFTVQVPGGNGPATLYAQAVTLDPAQPLGFGISNAVAIELLP